RYRMTGAAQAILPGWHSASDHELYCVVVLVATAALRLNHDQERERRMSVKLKLASLAVGAAVALTGGAAQADQIRLMTGPQGGSWIPLGGQLKDIWEKAIPGLQVQSLPGAGVANVRAIETDKAEVGFGNTITTADAIRGNPPFKEPHKKVCN